MSTRRTTRAGSRAVSNSGASPAPTNISDIPATPSRRRPRSANAGLPAVGTKTSTAYGSAGVARPARVSNPQGSEQIGNVLEGLLHPEDPNAENATSRVTRANSRTPALRQTSRATTPATNVSGHTPIQGGGHGNVTPNHSFHSESGIFGNAGIESSSMAETNDLSNIAEEPEPNDIDSDDSAVFPPKVASPQSMAHRQLEELARANARRNAAPVHPMNTTTPSTAPHAVPRGSGVDRWTKLESFLDQISTIAQNIWTHPYRTWGLISLAGLLLSLLLATLLAAPRTLHWYGPFDVRHNIGQFIPSGLAYPLLPDDALSIRKRLNSIESDIIIIKRDLKGIDFKAVHRLEELLPDFLVVKKKNGQRQIPDDFWHALQQKIRADETLMNVPAPSGKQSSGTSGGVSENKVRTIVADEWAKYLGENEAKLGKFSEEEFVRKFPKLLEENDVVPRAEIIEMIRQNWEDNSSRIMSEMGHLSKQLERASRDVTKLQHQSSTKLTRDEIKAIAHDVLRFIPDAQLNAAANANLQNSVNWGLTKVNHFATFTGAIVNSAITSPTWVFPSQDVWFAERWKRNLMRNPVPVPSPPEAALTRWEEYGDCWCSPVVDSETGYGPSLGVLMGASIYPEQVVIEHISSTATLTPGAAPREMELLAFVPDPESFKAISSLSNDLFKDEAREETGKFSGYVRIATWTYDAESPQNVQPFTVQLDMKSLGAHTSRLVVRSKNNWGSGHVPYTCLYRVRVHGEIAVPMPLE